jgi:hypothetical protein
VEAGSNTSTVALRVVGGDEKGSLESETENIVTSPTGLGPENDCAGNCKRQTRPLVREIASHQQTRNCLTVITIWSQAPDGCFTPRETGRLTVGGNVRLWLRLRLGYGQKKSEMKSLVCAVYLRSVLVTVRLKVLQLIVVPPGVCSLIDSGAKPAYKPLIRVTI